MRAKKDFEHITSTFSKLLVVTTSDKNVRAKTVEQFKTMRMAEEDRAKAKAELGEWFTDYLESSGWWVENQPTMWKQMITQAFPPLVDNIDDEITPDNWELMIKRTVKVYRMHQKMEEESDVVGADAASKAASAFLAAR